jgi:hypothetical protein
LSADRALGVFENFFGFFQSAFFDNQFLFGCFENFFGGLILNFLGLGQLVSFGIIPSCDYLGTHYSHLDDDNLGLEFLSGQFLLLDNFLLGENHLFGILYNGRWVFQDPLDSLDS